MDAAAVVHRLAFDDRLPWLAGLHSPEEDRNFFRTHVYDACAVWGAFEGGGLTGFIAFRRDWIDHLYVRPDQQGGGVGTALLSLAKARFDLLQLWAFQKNTGARAFYERRGFRCVETTDGGNNDEREPDARYEWRADVRDTPN